MTNAPPIVVGDGSPLPHPPPVDRGSDSDSDNYSPQEPQFVIHAVDDDRRLPPAAAILPIQNRAPTVEEQAADREAARIHRLRYFLILPQALLCACVVDLGVVMMCLANTAAARANLVWVFLCSALVIFFALVSLLLSYLAVYHYDGWPCLDNWFVSSSPRNQHVPIYY